VSAAGRRAVREEIAAGLEVALASTAAAVYPYQAAIPAGLSPVVRIFSAGIQRPPLAADGTGRTHMRFTVQTWVLLYGDNWTEEDAENTLDALEEGIANWVWQNQLGHSWSDLRYTELSTVDNAVIEGGTPYIVEDIPLEVWIYG